MPWILTVSFAIAGLVLAIRDPRRLQPGIFLTLAVASILMPVTSVLFDGGARLISLPEQTRDVLQALLFLFVPVLAGIGLGGALVANGFVMLRREGRSLANRLSLLTGVGILCVIAVGFVAVAAGWLELAVILLLLVGPIGYVGIGFFAYLCWSLVYARIARRVSSPAAIVTLGSGLRRDGSVPPLLGQRVSLGVRMLQLSPDAVLVLSGGRGDDEPRSEAAAMSEFAADLGVPRERMLVEDASRTTQQNLLFTRGLLAENDINGPVLAVTSDYHAFRAATLLRTLGIPGHAVGARTARYYLPSALLREYLALLRDHRLGNTIALVLLMAPLLTFTLASLNLF